MTYKTKGKENRRESYLKLLTKHFKKTHEDIGAGLYSLKRA